MKNIITITSLLAAALGISAVPAPAANVTVYESNGTTEVASGNSLDEVKDSIQSGRVVVFSGDASSGAQISFSGDTVLTLKSSTAGTQCTIKGQADYFFFSTEGALTLNLTDLIVDGANAHSFAFFISGISVAGENVTIRNMGSNMRNGAIATSKAVSISGTTTFENNISMNSGGVINAGRAVSISGTTTFENNSAERLGGAIYTSGDISISGTTTFKNNKAGTYGGAIYLNGNVSISGTTTFENNSAGKGAGAIYLNGNVTFSGDGSSATFSGNTVNGKPNDVWAKGNVVIKDAGTYSFGGGIEMPWGSLTISGGADVTFKGGAINSVGGKATISGAGTRVTFANADAGASNTFKGGLTIADGATVTFADFSRLSVSGMLTVEATATATLNADADATLGNLAGAGTVEKTGAGTLTLDTDRFTGTLKISAGDAVLVAGKRFGTEHSRLEYLAAGKTLTLGADSTIAGTLALGAGTTLELGGRDAKARVSVGGLAAGGSSALPVSAGTLSASASSGSTRIVHDVYSATDYDVLNVAGTGVDLSFATAALRAGPGFGDLSLLNAPNGLTLTLVEGDVTHGYGAVAYEGFLLTNFALSADGRTVSLGLGVNALAAGIFPLETTAAQRSVAVAATRAGTASGYGAALNALTNPHETLAALDALGAGHAAAMIPAQIDGAWNRLRSVMNAAGTGARLGAETELAAWAQYVGSWTDVDSSRERASWTRRMHGAHVGVERAFASGWTAGAALGYEDSEQKIGSAKIEDGALSASFYARRTQGAFTQTAVLSFARHDYETRRAVAFPGYAGRTRGDTDGFSAALSYEASYAFEVAEWVKLSPTAGLSAAWNTIESWTESGADAALHCDAQDALTWLAGVGVRADLEFANPLADGAKTRVGAYALFTAEMGDRSCVADAAFADTGAGFTARYDDPSRYAMQVGVTAAFPLNGDTSLFGGVSTELREDETNLNANLGVRFAW